MPSLTDVTGGLTFVLQLAEKLPDGRFLATASIEARDTRDPEPWPLVHLPVIRVAPQELAPIETWVSGPLELRLGEHHEVAFRLVPTETGALAEVGLDLGPWLQALTQRSGPPGQHLALFRFPVSRDAADGWRNEWSTLTTG